MNSENKLHSRKQFIGLGVSATAFLATLKFWALPKKKKKNNKTVTMLTQDGKLVEVDVMALPSKKKKITNKELQNWITKK
jgi:hypothetical protein